MGFVKANQIVKSFGSQKVLDQVSLEIEAGSQLIIQGASGSGKSTLLYLMGGLEKCDSGKVEVDGKLLNAMSDEELSTYRNRDIGFVFQFHFLLPSMSCMDNILLPAKIGMTPSEKIKDRSLELAKELGVEECLKKYPYQLSGGEQQRINLIRALSMSPKLLLCDEPTGNLDSENTEIVTSLIRNICKELGTTLVLVTHDQEVAAQFPARVYLQDGRLS